MGMGVGMGVRLAWACLRPVDGAVELLRKPAQSGERSTCRRAMHGQQRAVRLWEGLTQVDVGAAAGKRSLSGGQVAREHR